MSSDNYYQVWKYGDKFAVAMGFMSDDGGACVCDEDGTCCEETGKEWHPERLFDTLEEAMTYASSQYSEYGVFYVP